MTANRFNVVCPDKVLFNLEYEDAMRRAHIEYEAVKWEYLKRYDGCSGQVLGALADLALSRFRV